MYTTHTATREQALVAAAAAERAMDRHECCKSQFKFMCFSCGEFINRGDNITKCTAPCWDGMRLRFRGADSRNGLKDCETAFYLAETGTRTWVHTGCIPCYWDSLPEDSNEYSPPALRSAYTDWDAKISQEFFDECHGLTGDWNMAEFLKKHGYPQEKRMKDRIIHNVTRFQALWRGYLYKKAFPLALEQKRAEDANIWRGFLEWCGSLPHSTFRSFPRYCEVIGASAKVRAYGRKKYRECVLYPTIKKSSQSEPPLSWRQTLNSTQQRGPQNVPLWEFAENIIVQRTREREGFLCDNPIGTQIDILMDAGFGGAAIYSAEVANHTSKYMVANGESHLYFWVRFHHDDEVRKYNWKRLLTLQLECEAFKSKHGILCCGPTGKMPVALYIKTRKTKNKKNKKNKKTKIKKMQKK